MPGTGVRSSSCCDVGVRKDNALFLHLSCQGPVTPVTVIKQANSQIEVVAGDHYCLVVLAIVAKSLSRVKTKTVIELPANESYASR